MPTVLTVCPFCSCGCAVYLEVLDGRPVGAFPSEHHPIAQGGLCARGWVAHQPSVWGERLTTPMIRLGGALSPASWSDAIDHTVTRLSELRRTSPVGVLGSPRATNEENYLAVKLARAGLGTPNIASCQGVAGGQLIAGIADVAGSSPPLLGVAEVAACDFVLLVEDDLACSHPRLASSILGAVRRGGRLVTVGARTSQMARVAACHLGAEPGAVGDVVNRLLAGSASAASGRAFYASERCDDYDRLRGRLAAIQVGPESTEVARWLAAAKRAAVVVVAGTVPVEQARAHGAAWASLLAITGHLNQEGSGIVVAQSRANALGALHMGVEPDRLPGWLPADDREARDRLTRVWRAVADFTVGRPAGALIEEARGLVVVADDPIAALPNPSRTRAAIAAAEFVVVLDAFATETARLAEVILPIASFAESNGTYTSTSGGLQRLRAAAAPPGDARPGFEVIAELNKRLGGGPGYSAVVEVFREISTIAPGYAGMRYRTLEEGWELRTNGARGVGRPRLRAAAPAPARPVEWPWTVGCLGDHDWGSDPLVRGSPLLRRDPESRHKLFPGGWVELSRLDAEEMGVRSGRAVRLSSAYGEAVLPAQIQPEIARRVALVPFAYREFAAAALGPLSAVAARVEPA